MINYLASKLKLSPLCKTLREYKCKLHTERKYIQYKNLTKTLFKELSIKKTDNEIFLKGKTLEQALHKEIENGPEANEKMLNIIPSLGKCKLKPWDSISCALVQLSQRKADNSKCWLECGETTALIHWWWECKMAYPCPLENNLVIPQNIKVYDPTITLLGIYWREVKTQNLYWCW